MFSSVLPLSAQMPLCVRHSIPVSPTPLGGCGARCSPDIIAGPFVQQELQEGAPATEKTAIWIWFNTTRPRIPSLRTSGSDGSIGREANCSLSGTSSTIRSLRPAASESRADRQVQPSVAVLGQGETCPADWRDGFMRSRSPGVFAPVPAALLMPVAVAPQPGEDWRPPPGHEWPLL